MRIGIYLGSWRLTRLGGVGTYLRELLSGVHAVGAESSVVLIADRDNAAAVEDLAWTGDTIYLDRGRLDRLSRGERLRVIRARRMSYRSVERADLLRGQRWTPTARSYLWGLDDAVAAGGIDVLYFPLPPYLKMPAVPSLVAIHDLKHLDRPGDHTPADLARRRRWRRVARAAAGVICAYEHVRQDVIARLDVSPECVQLVRNAVPSAFLEAAPAGAGRRKCEGECRGKPGGAADRRDRNRGAACGASRACGGAVAALQPLLRPDSTVVRRLPEAFGLMPAQFWPHKNQDGVIRALARLRAEGVEIPMVFTGQRGGECADWAERVDELANRVGVADLAHYAGYVEDDALRELFGAARFVIAPMRYDPASFTVYQALAMGRPVIASRVGTVPETVGQAGLLIDPESDEQIAGAMKQLWSDDALCAKLAAAGPERVSRRRWSDVAGDWLTLCDHISRSQAALR